MAGFSLEQRAELRAALEQSRREAVAQSAGRAALKSLPPPLAAPARPLVVVPPLRPAWIGELHCVFCGSATLNYATACLGHTDLLEATG